MSSRELTEFMWKKRILLVMDAKNDLDTRNLQLNKFNGLHAEMRERDLVLFVYNGKEVLDRDGMITYINPDNIAYGELQGIILIGKDGGVKLRKKYTVEANEVFDLIDQMPMRRAEMKNR
ncbi:MAG: DUF4174 domain-containing protein [Eudoraea sp.]|uniref:DUF4174 domain-containing protein n=1 Tax=Eudoraea sp. TaxID=1979955 RepID=UPI0032662CC0